MDEFEEIMKRLSLESDPTYKDLFGDRNDRTKSIDFQGLDFMNLSIIFIMIPAQLPLSFEEFKQKMYYKLYPNHHSVKDLEDAFKYFDTGI